MARQEALLLVAVLLVSVPAARADLDDPDAPGCAESPRFGSLPQQQHDYENTHCSAQDQSPQRSYPNLADIPLGLTWRQSPPVFAPPAGDNPKALILHSGPSSLSLFFVSFSYLGLWRVGRSASRFRFGSAPAWFHTGGPIQVGHASAIDTSGPMLFAPCSQPLPGDHSRPPSFSDALRQPPPVAAQCFSRAHATRGPPLLDR